MSKSTSARRQTLAPGSEPRRDIDGLEAKYPTKEIIRRVYQRADADERETRIDALYRRMTGEARPHPKAKGVRAHIFGANYDASISGIRAHIFGRGE